MIDLADARGDRRLRDHQARLRHALDDNRGVLARLFRSGAIFTRAGSRLGRDLLLAHQHLLKGSDLLRRLQDLGEADPRGEPDPDTEALYADIDALLARTLELSERSEAILGLER